MDQSDLFQLVSLFYKDLWSLGNLEIADQIIHTEYDPDWVLIPKKGPEQIKHEVNYLRSVFSDINYEITDYVTSEEEQQVWARYAFSGRHTGTAWGFEATNKSFRTEGVGIFTIQDSRIIDRWGAFCMYDVFSELGLIPPWYDMQSS